MHSANSCHEQYLKNYEPLWLACNCYYMVGYEVQVTQVLQSLLSIQNKKSYSISIRITPA